MNTARKHDFKQCFTRAFLGSERYGPSSQRLASGAPWVRLSYFVFVLGRFAISLALVGGDEGASRYIRTNEPADSAHFACQAQFVRPGTLCALLQFMAVITSISSSRIKRFVRAWANLFYHTAHDDHNDQSDIGAASCFHDVIAIVQ